MKTKFQTGATLAEMVLLFVIGTSIIISVVVAYRIF